MTTVWQVEALSPEPSLKAGFVAFALFFELVVMVLPDVGDVLEKEHDQHVVFIVSRIEYAAKRIASLEQNGVDARLASFIRHVTSNNFEEVTAERDFCRGLGHLPTT